MNKSVKKVGWIFTLMLFSVCSASSRSLADRRPSIAIQIGNSDGGISNNTDLSFLDKSCVSSKSMKDAFTGASRSGYNIGLHLNQPLGRNQLEVGMDYMFNNQSFRYDDADNQFIGMRNINVNQLMLPLSYNIALFRNTFPRCEFLLKLGYMWQLNFVNAIGSGELPDYFISSVSRGATCGVSGNLWKFRNGSKLGLFYDVFRGSNIFTDYFNQPNLPMVGSSFVKSGIRYQF